MLTGDNELVSRKICREVGIADRSRAPGQPGRSDVRRGAGRGRRARRPCSPGCRPPTSSASSSALQSKGHVVGFLGDGINDAPALRAADVGISVDTAVDIAKESADVILLEKSLLVLEEGVLEGRKVFANILKYIRMGASSNFGNMFSVLGASVFLPFVPMAPAPDPDQQPALRFLAGAHSHRRRGPGTDRQAAPLVDERDRPVHPVHRPVQLGLRLHDLLHDALRLRLLGPGADASLFQTGWFVESLLTQTLIIHVIRTNRIPFLQSRASWPLIVTTAVIMVVGAWLPFSPLGPSLGFTPLPPLYWPLLGADAALLCAADAGGEDVADPQGVDLTAGATSTVVC